MTITDKSSMRQHGKNAIQASLIIPVFNEDANITLLFNEIQQAMSRQNRSWQVLFVDDGSTDGSLDILRSLAKTSPQAKYLAFAANKGQSAAFAAGFHEADGEVFITLDADLQNDPADIPAMLDLYDQGYDMIIGWRAKRNDNIIRRISSKIANAVRNSLSHEAVKDTGCSLKVLRASMARELPMFTGMHRFLPTLMKMKGATVAEIKVNHRPRLHGVSKYGVWNRAFAAFYDLFAIRWMQERSFIYEIKERDQ